MSIRQDSDATDGIIALFALGAWIANIFLDAFVAMKLWNWHIAGNFEQLRAITMYEGFGISLVISFLTYRYVPRRENEDKYYPLIQVVCMNALFLLFGWMGYKFFGP